MTKPPSISKIWEVEHLQKDFTNWRPLSKKEGKGVESLTINLDGPYGLPIDYNNYAVIVLVAGGIGITPCHAIYRQLARLATEKRLKCERVHLIWTFRDLSLFQDSSLLQTFSHPSSLVPPSSSSDGHIDRKENKDNDNDELKRTFTSSVYISRALPESKATGSLVLRSGRPDPEIELSFLLCRSNLGTVLRPVSSSSINSSNPNTIQPKERLDPAFLKSDGLDEGMSNIAADTFIFACGPDALVGSYRTFARGIGAAFHAETFLL